MNKATLQKEILETEKIILTLSEKAFAIKDIDSMGDWIIWILKREPELSRYLHFPSQKKIKGALINLLEVNSHLTHPIVYLLSNRIAAYIATIEDLYNHPLRGSVLSPMLTNFEPLIKLIKKYKDNYEHPKTIQLICDALKGHRLHIYKSSPNEPDLRVALRAFYEDKNRDNFEAITTILDFVFQQLSEEKTNHGFISQPRHAWWALQTIVKEADSSWLNKNKTDLNNILKHLLSASVIEYSPRTDMDFTSRVPELDSPYNEKTWTTINAIRILKNNAALYLPAKTIELLKAKIESNIHILVNDKPEDSLKHLQSKLILLYDALGYYNVLEAVEMASQKVFNLKNRTVGKYLYADEVITSYKSISNSIQTFIKNPSKLKKPTLSSMLISGSPGQGKSELASQLVDEFEKIARLNNKDFIHDYFTIGTQIRTQEELLEKFQELCSVEKADTIRVVVFDEFDKATFDLYAPFLPFLEKPVNANAPLTFWIFAQSSFPNFALFNSYSQTLSNKAMRDFITRLQLGFIDLPELKVSPQQKAFSAIGIAKGGSQVIKKISRSCFLYFATNEKLQNIRDLMSDFTRHAEISNCDVVISQELEDSLKESDFNFKNIDGFIKLEL